MSSRLMGQSAEETVRSKERGEGAELKRVYQAEQGRVVL